MCEMKFSQMKTAPKNSIINWVETRFQVKKDRNCGSTGYVLIFWDPSQSENLINITLIATETGLILTHTYFTSTKQSAEDNGCELFSQDPQWPVSGPVPGLWIRQHHLLDG